MKLKSITYKEDVETINYIKSVTNHRGVGGNFSDFIREATKAKMKNERKNRTHTKTKNKPTENT